MADDSEAASQASAVPADGAGESAGAAPAAPARPLETREEMLERHRAEAKELVKKEMAMKKAAAKGSKAEQKAKKKAAEEKVQALEAEMKARHKRELDALAADAATAGVAGLAVSGEGGGRGGGEGAGREGAEAGGGGGGGGAEAPRVSRAQKRREKKTRQEAERAARIEEEQEGLVSERAVEEQRLAAKLSPLGLTLREVKPDGHCLFRAVEDQLRGVGVGVGGVVSGADGCGGEVDFWGLRAAAAAYMLAHADDFMPFVVAELASGDLQPHGDGPAAVGGGGGGGGAADGLGGTSLSAAAKDWEGEPEERRMFLRYCHEVEHTAAWGGQLELQALAQSLRRHIIVYSADLPDVNLGLEYAPATTDAAIAGGAGGASAAADGAAAAESNISAGSVACGPAPIRVSFHRHAYGLGEHYNSVVPLPVVAAGSGLLGDVSEEE
ncbi:hypothetical protein CLOM_g21786 [Closterium sp. NIES-68]|nr:hypothetical protein CLOM_g21786 [Closterium sp. NIES-68]